MSRFEHVTDPEAQLRYMVYTLERAAQIADRHSRASLLGGCHGPGGMDCFGVPVGGMHLTALRRHLVHADTQPL